MVWRVGIPEKYIFKIYIYHYIILCLLFFGEIRRDHRTFRMAAECSAKICRKITENVPKCTETYIFKNFTFVWFQWVQNQWKISLQLRERTIWKKSKNSFFKMKTHNLRHFFAKTRKNPSFFEVRRDFWFKSFLLDQKYIVVYENIWFLIITHHYCSLLLIFSVIFGLSGFVCIFGEKLRCAIMFVRTLWTCVLKFFPNTYFLKMH